MKNIYCSDIKQNTQWINESYFFKNAKVRNYGIILKNKTSPECLWNSWDNILGTLDPTANMQCRYRCTVARRALSWALHGERLSVQHKTRRHRS